MLPGPHESLLNRMGSAYYLLFCMHVHTNTHTSHNRMVLVVLCFLSVFQPILSLGIVHWSANIRPWISDTNVFKMYYWPLKRWLVRRSPKTLYVKSVVSISDETHRYTARAMSEGLQPTINFLRFGNTERKICFGVKWRWIHRTGKLVTCSARERNLGLEMWSYGRYLSLYTPCAGSQFECTGYTSMSVPLAFSLTTQTNIISEQLINFQKSSNPQR
jgi:hypothetical protein